MKQYIDTVVLIWRAGFANYPVTNSKSLFRRFRFYWHAFGCVASIDRWMHTDAPCALQVELHRSAALLKSISNPYIHTLWPIQKRMFAISQHYRMLSDLNLRFLHFADDRYWDCVKFKMGEHNFRIVIDRPIWMRAEGEMNVSLFMGVDRLYSIAFSIGGTVESPRLLVGAIQGAPASVNGTVYSDLTKIFHGVRPRDLIVQILKMFAQNLGCNEVWGISDECHQSVGRGNESNKASKYNEIWMENGGIQNAEGFFAMSSAVHKRAEEDIPARKRALYRRRYEFMDALQASVDQSFIDGNIDTRPHGI